MFKVGMGEKPEAPETLSQEGHDFIDHCLQHDPKDRLTALELLQQNFCKVSFTKFFKIHKINLQTFFSSMDEMKISIPNNWLNKVDVLLDVILKQNN